MAQLYVLESASYHTTWANEQKVKYDCVTIILSRYTPIDIRNGEPVHTFSCRIGSIVKTLLRYPEERKCFKVKTNTIRYPVFQVSKHWMQWERNEFHCPTSSYDKITYQEYFSTLMHETSDKLWRNCIHESTLDMQYMWTSSSLVFFVCFSGRSYVTLKQENVLALRHTR